MTILSDQSSKENLPPREQEQWYCPNGRKWPRMVGNARKWSENKKFARETPPPLRLPFSLEREGCGEAEIVYISTSKRTGHEATPNGRKWPRMLGNARKWSGKQKFACETPPPLRLPFSLEREGCGEAEIVYISTSKRTGHEATPNGRKWPRMLGNARKWSGKQKFACETPSPLRLPISLERGLW